MPSLHAFFCDLCFNHAQHKENSLPGVRNRYGGGPFHLPPYEEPPGNRRTHGRGSERGAGQIHPPPPWPRPLFPPGCRVHGGGVTGIEVWRNNVPYFLNQGYRVLSYDLYGRGYSDRPAEENTPELLGDQLIELIDTLGIRAPFDIVAMSLGAIIALDFAVKYPERVSKMVLIDPTATGDYKPSWMIRVPVVSDLVMTCYWHPRAVEHQRKEFVNQSLFEAYAQRLRYFMNFKGYKEMTHATWTHILNQNRLALVKKLPPNRMLILYADRDPFIPKIYLYQQVYPSLKSVLIRDAGHMPHYEKPEEVNPIIGDFLRETTP